MPARQLTAAFQVLGTNAHALDDTCRAMRGVSDEIVATADSMATRTDAMVGSVRELRTRLVALTKADD